MKDKTITTVLIVTAVLFYIAGVYLTRPSALMQHRETIATKSARDLGLAMASLNATVAEVMKVRPESQK